MRSDDILREWQRLRLDGIPVRVIATLYNVSETVLRKYTLPVKPVYVFYDRFDNYMVDGTVREIADQLNITRHDVHNRLSKMRRGKMKGSFDIIDWVVEL